MKKLYTFFRKLFSLRNLAPMSVIILALIGGLNISFLGLDLPSDQLIMALLGFLAIDALVERIDILSGIEEKINSLDLDSQTAGKLDRIFQTRTKLPSMVELIESAQEEINILGVSLETTVAMSAFLKEKLINNRKVKLIGLDPNSACLTQFEKYFTEPIQVDRLKSNFISLSERIKNPSGKNLDIRTLDIPYTTGYIIIDPNTPDGHMVVQNYMYGFSTEESTAFRIIKKDDPVSFKKFYDQFQNFYEKSTEFVTGND